MATQTFTRSSISDNLLRRSLQADGVICALFGADLVIWGSPIASFLGLDNPTEVITLGAITGVWGLFLFWRASQRELDRRLGLAAIGLNAIWVIASLLIILTNTPALTTEGKWAVGIVAALVDTLATIQFFGLRRARR